MLWRSSPRPAAPPRTAASACGRHAARSPSCSNIVAVPCACRGTAPWCSGATVVEGALVAAEADDGAALVLVRLDAHGVQLCEPTWVSPAFAETDTRSVAFDVEVDDDAVIGRGGWYVERPGFWHGAVGVAACWAGCVEGSSARVPLWRDDPHARAHLGAIDALSWSMAAALAGAAAEIDASPATWTWPTVERCACAMWSTSPSGRSPSGCSGRSDRRRWRWAPTCSW